MQTGSGLAGGEWDTCAVYVDSCYVAAVKGKVCAPPIEVTPKPSPRWIKATSSSLQLACSKSSVSSNLSRRPKLRILYALATLEWTSIETDKMERHGLHIDQTRCPCSQFIIGDMHPPTFHWRNPFRSAQSSSAAKDLLGTTKFRVRLKIIQNGRNLRATYFP